MPAHPVGDRPQPDLGPCQKAVLVVAPQPADMGRRAGIEVVTGRPASRTLRLVLSIIRMEAAGEHVGEQERIGHAPAAHRQRRKIAAADRPPEARRRLGAGMVGAGSTRTIR